jgi:branched-chain amino acid transport system ATP-binding protein
MGLARTFQRETSFDGLTVYENALIGATYGKAEGSRTEARDRAAEALEFVGLGGGNFGRLAGELSVFDRKCLMLATAIASAPRMLLLDEPASGLTKPEIDASITLIRRIGERGVTIVLIEHVLTFLMSLSQHLVVLNYGSVLAAGEPRTVIADQRVVEAYLGTRRVE